MNGINFQCVKTGDLPSRIREHGRIYWCYYVWLFSISSNM